MYKQIKANAASVPDTLGGGRHRHLWIITDTVKSNRITPNNTYILPAHPEPLGVNNGKESKILEGIRQNKIVITTFHEENQIERTIINQVQADLDYSVLMPKINEYTRVPDCNIIDLMKYRFCSYGNISDQKLHDERIKTNQHQYFHNNPIANVFKIIHT